MRALLAAVVAVWVAPPAMAEGALTGKAFESYVTNKTITWDYGSGTTGAEQYLPGRRVRWAFEDDRCMTGTWYAEGENSCFLYDDGTPPDCWRFERVGKGLRAQYMSTPGGRVITEIGSVPEPLACEGPEVGV